MSSSDPQYKKKESVEQRQDAEQTVNRNPHGNFSEVQASRPDFNHSLDGFHYTKTPAPAWQLGEGGNDGGASVSKKQIQIDPYEEGRPAVFNYKLMISAIVPRPIGFVSTRSKDGTSTNLAPFSYFQMYNHDPPTFCIGYAGGFDNAKDSLKNLRESGECVVNMISEHFIEAANSTSINAPYGVSEWALSGLHPASCTEVACSRVAEAVFAVECKLTNLTELESRVTPGKKTGVIATVEGLKFWVREDAINEDKNLVDPAVLRPMSRLGGITYARVNEGLELPRPDYEESVKKAGKESTLVKPKIEGQ